MVSATPVTRRWLIASLFANAAAIALAAALWVYVGGWQGARALVRAVQTPPFSATRLYQGRVDTWKQLPAHPGALVFLGDSLTDYAPLAELFGANALNRGLAGDRVRDIAARAGEVARHRPATVVLWVGVNDLLAGRDCATIASDIAALARRLHADSPAARLIVLGPAPVVPDPARRPADMNEAIRCLNRALPAELAGAGATVLDPAQRLTDAGGDLDPAFTLDGVHLNGAGYRAWAAWLAPALGRPLPD